MLKADNEIRILEILLGKNQYFSLGIINSCVFRLSYKKITKYCN